MKLLEGQVALVTGASGGIGRGIALRFAEEGAAVALLSQRGHPQPHGSRNRAGRPSYRRATSPTRTLAGGWSVRRPSGAAG